MHYKTTSAFSTILSTAFIAAIFTLASGCGDKAKRKRAQAQEKGDNPAEVKVVSDDLTSENPSKPEDSDGDLKIANLASGKDKSGKKTVWHRPKFVNGWEDFGAYGCSKVYYWRDEMGYVHIQGSLKGGQCDAAAFHLPKEYRPAGGNLFFVGTDVANNPVRIAISPFFDAAVTIGHGRGACDASQVHLGHIVYLAVDKPHVVK